MNKSVSISNKIEVKKYRLSTVSPVHIQGGDGSGDYGQGYIVKPNDNKFIYIIDTFKLQKYLFYNHGGFKAVNAFNQWLENDRSKKSGITEFLKSKDINFDFKKTNEVSKGKVHIQSKKGNNFIRNGMNRAYIPGSSIKGAIRTAVLWKILQNIRKHDCKNFDKKMRTYIDQKIQSFKQIYNNAEKNKFKQNFDNELAKDIFQAFVLKSSRMDEKHEVENDSPFTDLFKAVKVKDTQVINDEFILPKKWGLLSLENNKPYMKFSGKNIQIYQSENMSKGNDGAVCFEIILDLELLDNFKKSVRKSTWGNYDIPFKNIDELMAIVFDFSRSISQELSKFYTEFCKKPPAAASKSSTENMVGKVKFIKQENEEKTYGFINIPDSEDVFFHISSVRRTDKEKIKKNDIVVISGVEKTDRGLKAKEVWVDSSQTFEEPFLNINSLRDFYNSSSFGGNINLMKIGWGTGILGTTIAMFLKDCGNIAVKRDGESRHILQILRDEVLHHKVANKGKYVPKSTRVICNLENEPAYPLGWVRLDQI